MVKNQPADAGDIRDVGSILGLGRSPRGGHRNPLQYSFPENPMDNGASWATVHTGKSTGVGCHLAGNDFYHKKRANAVNHTFASI